MRTVLSTLENVENVALLSSKSTCFFNLHYSILKMIFMEKIIAMNNGSFARNSQGNTCKGVGVYRQS